MFVCAKKQQEEIDKATNKGSKSGKSKTPLSITKSDSREDIEDKLSVIKNTFF